MKESKFIEQNKEKWKGFEDDIKNDDPARLSKLFVQVTDDLAYSQTFYKNRKVKSYLNGVAQVLFQKIYKSRKYKFKDFKKFWTTDLPLVLFQSRRSLLIATLVFGLSMLIGVFSFMKDPEFAKEILGESYVEMTLENINNNDPMAVYKKESYFDMFMGITVNNIYVAFRTFVLGVFMSIGTIFILVYNGIMLGVFQYFFVEKGLFVESFLTIWQHGTIEISSIIIAGGAGLTMGKGLVFPGTLTRSQSFRISAQNGIKIMIGIFPLFVLAGFIESVFTRETEVNDWIRLGVIVLCLAFVLFYFMLYPRYVAKKHFKVFGAEELPDYKEQFRFEFEKIESFGSILAGVFHLTKRMFLKMLVAVVIGVVVHTLVLIFAKMPLTKHLFIRSFYNPLLEILTGDNWITKFVLALLFTFLGVQASGVVKKMYLESNGKEGDSQPTIRMWMLGLIVSSLFMLLNTLGGLAVVGGLLLFPFFWLYNFHLELSQSFMYGAEFKKTWQLVKSNFGSYIIVVILFGLISFLTGTLILSENFKYFLVNAILWNFDLSDAFYQQIHQITNVFLASFVIGLCALMMYGAIFFLYFSMKEKTEANYLIARIQKIGDRKSVFGFEKE